jgi:hypothetical protein
MQLFKTKNKDFSSILSSYPIDGRLIELLNRLPTGDFEHLFTNRYHAELFRITVYEQCKEPSNYCKVIIFPGYLSFLVDLNDPKVGYNVVVGINDDELLFANIVQRFYSWAVTPNFDTMKKVGIFDLFGNGTNVLLYVAETASYIYGLYGFHTEVTKPSAVIDASQQHAVRVQGDLLMIVIPFDSDNFARSLRGEFNSYINYLWIDTLLTSFINNHISASVDQLMNILLPGFIWSSAPWVKVANGYPVVLEGDLVKFLTNLIGTVTKMGAKYNTPFREDVGREYIPDGCRFLRYNIHVKSTTLGEAVIAPGYCSNNGSVILRLITVFESEPVINSLIKDLSSQLKETRRTSIVRYFGNHKVSMENVVSFPFDYFPPEELSLKVLEPMSVRVGKDLKGHYYVDEKSVIRLDHPEHPSKEIRFNKQALIRFTTSNVADEHIRLMNTIVVSDFFEKLNNYS